MCLPSQDQPFLVSELFIGMMSSTSTSTVYIEHNDVMGWVKFRCSLNLGGKECILKTPKIRLHRNFIKLQYLEFSGHLVLKICDSAQNWR